MAVPGAAPCELGDAGAYDVGEIEPHNERQLS